MKKKLSEMDYGEQGTVTEIEKGLQKRIAGMGIRVGKNLRMVTKQPIKGPFDVVVDGAETSLGLDMAGKIVVEVTK
ncbi:MAG: ferrous iron transport protein A [Methanosarcinales archaeon]|nr:ferrous iron transport protein A [Methanosarcinales archaeon]MCK4651999.1 ferrous iron transport protein A [Methanosarcinales archaeon]MCK4811535.1 ferrous iron transport protein A [Methanosarcinales archaeon]